MDPSQPIRSSASHDDSDRSHLAETVAHTPSSRGELEVRCPSCRSAMDVAVDTALTDLTCPSCGDHFSLVDQSQATRMAPTLSQMGRFELVERLGVGGFGSVWKARDKELDRTVAIKIPRQGGMTAEEQEKFFREARAAAQLRHPNIVSVHEVGRDGDSVYIVSDLVRGVTLGDWLSGQQLTSREAAELCAKIADALHHAHEKGIVHRDLKPANIMMDGDGQPHLMDFGLARREAGELTVTMDGQVIGTPAYMSPEQAEGKAHTADRRSDVYSLGVILFQLLTGEIPFRGNARMLMHQVINDEPPSPRKLNAHVAKDLETITLKCLEKDPARRYRTAAQLAEELRRFLVGEPIQARPIGAMDRTWRWAKRNPRVAVLTASVAVLLMAVAAVSAVGFAVAKRQQIAAQQAAEREAVLRAEAQQLAAREAEQRNLAEQNLAIAQNAVDSYLTKVADDPRLKQSDFHKLRTELLQTAVPFYEQFAEQKPDDARSQANQADAYARLASIHGETGESSHAMREFEQAIAIQKQLVAARPEEPSYQLTLADQQIELGWTLHVVGKYAEAKPHYEEALSVLSALVEAYPSEPAYKLKLARAHEKLGMLLRNSNRNLAIKQFSEALNVLEAPMMKSPTSIEYQTAVASTSFYLGVIFVRDQPELGKTYLSIAANFQRNFVRANPNDPEYRSALADSLSHLGLALNLLRDVPASRRHFDEALHIQEAVVGDFPSVVKYRVILGSVHYNYAEALRGVFDLAGAFKQSQKFAEVREKLALDFPDMANAAQLAANIHWNCAQQAEKLGDQAAAMRHHRSRLDLLRGRAEHFSDNPRVLSDYIDAITTSPARQPDDVARAIPLASKAAELTNHSDPAILVTLATLQLLNDDVDAAKRSFELASSAYEKRLATRPNDRKVRVEAAVGRAEVVSLLADRLDPAEARPICEEVLAEFKNLSDGSATSQCASWEVFFNERLGALTEQLGDSEAAMKYREEALAIYDARLNPAANSMFGWLQNAVKPDPRRQRLVAALNKHRSNDGTTGNEPTSDSSAVQPPISDQEVPKIEQPELSDPLLFGE